MADKPDAKRMDIEVKDFDSVERAVGAIASTVHELGESVHERLEGLDRNQAVLKESLEAMTQRAMTLKAEEDRVQLKIRLSGKSFPADKPRHPNPEVDEVLSTYNPPSPYREVQERTDELYVAQKLLAAMPYGMDTANLASAVEGRRKAVNEACRAAGIKALDTAESGGGSQWVPTGSSAELTGRFYLALRVADLFDRFDIPGAGSSYTWPAMSAGATAYKVSQNTADYTVGTQATVTPSQLTTYAATFTPVCFGVRTDVSREITEDSIIAITPTIYADHAVALAEGLEDAILFGSVDTTHSDLQVLASTTSVYRTFDGIRDLAEDLAEAYTDCGAIAFDDTAVLALLKKMGKWAIDPTKMAILVGPKGYYQMLAFDKVKTVQNYGAQATLVRGELGNFAGIPVAPSGRFMDVSDTGYRDLTAANWTKTLLFAVNHRTCKIGFRRGVTMESFYDPRYQQISLIGTMRAHWVPMHNPATSGNTFLGWMYDITA